ncbi:hypothetical protein GUJ93_ZPchr0008g12192 [Zizania palustris]|uniref:Uncharacterized protein n=1 Tax=Zizania palustris TaxID=103762 RepID=A0A8J5RID6_ZIZPA|nr:hypothetical protein GUJ93_ZPchr0008g12192 [Zizania palustris]
MVNGHQRTAELSDLRKRCIEKTQMKSESEEEELVRGYCQAHFHFAACGVVLGRSRSRIRLGRHLFDPSKIDK